MGWDIKNGVVLDLLVGRNPTNPPRVNDAAGHPELVLKPREVANVANGAVRAKRERELRLQAVHVVSMLPDDPSEAQRVLDYAQKIVTDFVERERAGFSVVTRD